MPLCLSLRWSSQDPRAHIHSMTPNTRHATSVSSAICRGHLSSSQCTPSSSTQCSQNGTQVPTSAPVVTKWTSDMAGSCRRTTRPRCRPCWPPCRLRQLLPCCSCAPWSQRRFWSGTPGQEAPQTAFSCQTERTPGSYAPLARCSAWLAGPQTPGREVAGELAGPTGSIQRVGGAGTCMNLGLQRLLLELCILCSGLMLAVRLL